MADLDAGVHVDGNVGGRGAQAERHVLPHQRQRRADGRLQVTYNHHPLYTFVKDTKAGQTNGEGLNALGADWDAISPAGVEIDPKKHSTPTPPAKNQIPQNNGGDGDSDNNGGPSDGDGNV